MSLFSLLATVLLCCNVYPCVAYYLSPNAMTWDSSRQFCIDICNSDLASIHDSTQNQDVINISNDIRSFSIDSSSMNIWIGLDGTMSSWSDGSSLIFGNNFANGQDPWKTSQIVDSSKCTAMIISSNYQWDLRACNNEYRALCNDCNENINKYFVISETKNWEDAYYECELQNSHLLSIHSERDYDEATTLCELISPSDGCHVGLREETTNNYWWSDDTIYSQYDYIYDEWQDEIAEGVTGNCVYLEREEEYGQIEYEIDGINCQNSLRPFLCNMPSELCFLDLPIDGVWFYLYDRNEVTLCDIEVTDFNHECPLLTITDKEFINFNHIIIEYTFIVYDNQGRTGIVVENDAENYSYFIAISVADQTTLEIFKSDFSTPISSLPLNIEQSVDETMYVLHITIDRNLIQVIVNDHFAFSWIDDDISSSDIAYNNIVLRNCNLALIAKSLYTSTPYLLSPPTNAPSTYSPTTDIPTETPTNEPSTSQPTLSPTTTTTTTTSTTTTSTSTTSTSSTTTSTSAIMDRRTHTTQSHAKLTFAPGDETTASRAAGIAQQQHISSTSTTDNPNIQQLTGNQPMDLTILMISISFVIFLLVCLLLIGCVYYRKKLKKHETAIKHLERMATELTEGAADDKQSVDENNTVINYGKKDEGDLKEENEPGSNPNCTIPNLDANILIVMENSNDDINNNLNILNAEHTQPPAMPQAYYTEYNETPAMPQSYYQTTTSGEGYETNIGVIGHNPIMDEAINRAIHANSIANDKGDV